MNEFWSDYIWPLLIMVGESVFLLVILLIAIAYVLYADRKIWAAVQIRRGPNVVGPWGLFQSFADLLKFVLKEPVIPAGANKGVFLLAPLVAWSLTTMLGWRSRASVQCTTTPFHSHYRKRTHASRLIDNWRSRNLARSHLRRHDDCPLLLVDGERGLLFLLLVFLVLRRQG